jgi:hypothetical protein
MEKPTTVTADYVLQGVNPQQIATAPFDVQVDETSDDSSVPFTAAQVKQMESGGSQVLGRRQARVAVEYVIGATKIADVHAQAAQDGIRSCLGHLDLDGVDTDGVLPEQTVQPVGTSTPPIGTGTNPITGKAGVLRTPG